MFTIHDPAVFDVCMIFIVKIDLVFYNSLCDFKDVIINSHLEGVSILYDSIKGFVVNQLLHQFVAACMHSQDHSQLLIKTTSGIHYIYRIC